MTDFFISYNRADESWAEWIGWVLEEEGKSVRLQAWDFRPGSNFILEMQRASVECGRTLAVLSDAYLKAVFTQPEWAAAFQTDPTGQGRHLVPVRVQDCRATGMLGPIVHIDLVGLSESGAREALFRGLEPGRSKPAAKPAFPGVPSGRPNPGYPGSPAAHLPLPSQEGVSSTNTAVIVRDEFSLFQEVFSFAKREMDKTSTGGEEFARQWVRDFADVEFSRFKDAFSFAKTEMAKTSTGAEIFAFDVIKRIRKN